MNYILIISLRYLDTCSKNDVILLSEKVFVLLGFRVIRLGVELELAKIRLNIFLVKRPFGQAY